MKDIVFIKMPVKFPIKPNSNGICFTEELIEESLRNIQNQPIISNNVAIGVIKDIETINRNENEVIVDTKGYLYVECFPEIIIKEREGNTIKSFELSAININNDL